MKKAITTLRWHNIYADIKPKIGDKCLISDDDGNISIAKYCCTFTPFSSEPSYHFMDLENEISNYVYCWAKIPEILSDIQLNNVDKEA